MEAKELRLGNLVYLPSEAVYSVDVLYKDYDMLKHWKPIPLTEDWLLKSGLKEFDGYFQKNMGFYSFKIKEGVDISGDVYFHPEKYSWTMFGFVGRLYFVHQLQNMYFALTGEELTIKP